MSTNIPRTNQFDSSYSGATLGQSEGPWNRSSMNTPQNNPSSWPQLGSPTSEVAEQQSASMPQAQTIPNQLQNISSRDETGWNVGGPNSASAPNPETDLNGPSAWGRMPDSNSKNTPASSSGWGVPSNSWGQHQTAVDDGTAVWSKSNINQQTQGNWGGQLSSSNESTSNGWGVTEPVPAVNVHNQEASAHLQSSKPQQQHVTLQPSLPSSTQASNSKQPATWAKAASTGLTDKNIATEVTSSEEQETTEALANVPSPLTEAALEPDPVQELVNSHEGWGKKPIQQETTWNITDAGNGLGRPGNSIHNGTEAWGKPSGGPMPPGPGWGDVTSNKCGASWNGNYNQPSAPAAPGQNWGVPPQQQPSRSFPSNNTGGVVRLSESQQSHVTSGMKWNEMPSQNSSGQARWGAPPIPQPPIASGWNGPQLNDNSPAWGNGPPRTAQSWGNSIVPQSPNKDQQQWCQSNETPHRLAVDDGTSAWGDPGTYSKVNMWDKRGQGNVGSNDNTGIGSQMVNSNVNIESKGWGAPGPTNRPPSPKSWNKMTPQGPVDNCNSTWGQKPISGERFDKGSGMGNWNAGKLSSWNQSNDHQWGQTDNGSNWGPPIGKVDNMMKNNNMDFVGSRRIIPPQPNVNQQSMPQNQMPSLSPQLQNQFHQIRQAVVNGWMPPEVLSPQYMSSTQHLQNLIQFVNKKLECQKFKKQIDALTQNKNISPNTHPPIEYLLGMLRNCQQQMAVQRFNIMQTMLPKPQQNMSKTNGPPGGMDLSGMRGGAQSMMSSLNNLNSLGQALPPSLPLQNMSSNTQRETTSRLLNNWKQPNPMGGMGDNPQHPMFSKKSFNHMGPSGDGMFNGLGFRRIQDELQRGGEIPTRINPSAFAASTDLMASMPSTGFNANQNSALADVGPPGFFPGIRWEGVNRIDPESDPNITPGSVAIAKTMSINTVRDADQVLKGERGTLSESLTAARTDAITYSLSSNDKGNGPTAPPAWSTGTNSAAATNTVSNTPSTLFHDLWRGPAASQFSSTNQAAAFQPTKALAPTWDQPSTNTFSSEKFQSLRSQQGSSWSASSPDNRGVWIVLNNFTNQVDVASVQQLCRQQGRMVSFKPHYPIDSMALVKYSTPDDAVNAKNALNVFMAGPTMLVASIATDQQVNNFLSATSSDSYGSTSGNANRFMSGGAGSTGGFMTQPSQRHMVSNATDMGGSTSMGNFNQQRWSTSSSSNTQSAVWSNKGSLNAAWSGATGEDPSRTMSPMHNFLPENLLGGGESI